VAERAWLPDGEARVAPGLPAPRRHVRQLDGTGLKRLHRAWRDRTSGRLALILDGLGTPANVGAIVRTAAAYRVERRWLAGRHSPTVGAGRGEDGARHRPLRPVGGGRDRS